ncbi:MAG: replication-associated recombination protein A [Patescibacteria group bacterium]|nr:replication-associated recombination protein A [Patescibacteria group bacterium]
MAQSQMFGRETPSTSPLIRGRKGDQKSYAPLADRMRPQSFDEIVGQDALAGKSSAFRRLVEDDHVPSCIFWGPPGSGKTTLAEVIANASQSDFIRLSAVTAGVADIRKIVQQTEEKIKVNGRRTILFIDEIHRFNKGQQDALLPYVERGTLVFIGATTENPSFEVNQALLSRAKVFVLSSLDENGIGEILERAIKDEEKGLGKLKLKVQKEAFNLMVKLSDGDARAALNLLEMSAQSSAKKEGGSKLVDVDTVKAVLQRSHVRYDKKGEEHYNVISALHKSLRGSDADAALYWMARMLEGGEDPMYVARRLVRFAAEDIGIADPQAMVQAVTAMQAVHLIGMPECTVHLAQAVVYMARAPKSNELYTAYGAAAADARETSDLQVPIHLRNAPTKLMKELGYGKDYKYNPNFKGPVDQDYLPKELKGRKYLK